MRCVHEPARWRAALRLGMALLALAVTTGACKDDDAAQGVAADSDDGIGSGDAEPDADASGTDGATAGATDASSGDDTAGGDWASLQKRPCPEGSFLTFENFGAIHMLNYCTGCHASGLPADQRQGAPIGIDFDGLDDVRRHAERIWARAGDANGTMPPAGAAPDEERALLGEWLSCGAPTDADLDAG